MSGIAKPIWPIVGFVLGLVVVLVISTLTLADSISADLSAAATTGAGFLTLIMLFAAINMFGRGGGGKGK